MLNWKNNQQLTEIHGGMDFWSCWLFLQKQEKLNFIELNVVGAEFTTGAKFSPLYGTGKRISLSLTLTGRSFGGLCWSWNQGSVSSRVTIIDHIIDFYRQSMSTHVVKKLWSIVRFHKMGPRQYFCYSCYFLQTSSPVKKMQMMLKTLMTCYIKKTRKRNLLVHIYFLVPKRRRIRIWFTQTNEVLMFSFEIVPLT